MDSVIQMSGDILTRVIMRLIRGYGEMLALLPERHRRAAEAQGRNSARVLFGVDDIAALTDTATLAECALEDLPVNIWRLMRAYERALAWLPKERRRAKRDKARRIFIAVFAALLPVLRDSGIKPVSLEGREFDPNYPVEAVNADDLDGEQKMIVAEMLEPVIMRDGKVARFGKLMLARKKRRWHSLLFRAFTRASDGATSHTKKEQTNVSGH